ncbi:hypothetical protein PG987_006683 [Apiospora arundinis]
MVLSLTDPTEVVAILDAVSKKSANEDRHLKSQQQQEVADQARDNLAMTMQDKRTAQGGNLQFGEHLLVEIRLLPRATVQYNFSDKPKAFDEMGEVPFIGFLAKEGSFLCIRGKRAAMVMMMKRMVVKSKSIMKEKAATACTGTSC